METLKVLTIPDYVLSSDIPLIKKYFKENSYGEVNHVELIEQVECEYQVDKDIYCAALVYIDKWYDCLEADKFKEQILSNNECAKIIYNDQDDYWVFEKANINYLDDKKNIEVDKLEVTDSGNSLKNEVENISNRLNNMDEYMNYTINGVQYLLEVDRCMIAKYNRLKRKQERNRKNVIAQRKWRNRLRPTNILRCVF